MTKTVGQSGAELRLLDPNQKMCHVREVTWAAVPKMLSDPRHSEWVHCQQAAQTLQAKLLSIRKSLPHHQQQCLALEDSCFPLPDKKDSNADMPDIHASQQHEQHEQEAGMH